MPCFPVHHKRPAGQERHAVIVEGMIRRDLHRAAVYEYIAVCVQGVA